MGEYFRLADFDDFLEVAQGCQNVFYMATEKTGGTELIAYAGRVYWKEDFDNEKALEEHSELLGDLRAKRVLETTDEVFR